MLIKEIFDDLKTKFLKISKICGQFNKRLEKTDVEKTPEEFKFSGELAMALNAVDRETVEFNQLRVEPKERSRVQSQQSRSITNKQQPLNSQKTQNIIETEKRPPNIQRFDEIDH